MRIISKVIMTAIALCSFSVFAEVSVIVNKANNNNIDIEMVKRIYLGKVKSFPSGDKVSVLSLANGNNETEQFRTNVLKKSSSQYKSYWSKLVFTGKGKPPKELANSAEMIDIVKSDVNAIGFVASSSVSEDVRVVSSF